MSDPTPDLIRRLVEALRDWQLGGAPPEDGGDAALIEEAEAVLQRWEQEPPANEPEPEFTPEEIERISAPWSYLTPPEEVSRLQEQARPVIAEIIENWGEWLGPDVIDEALEDFLSNQLDDFQDALTDLYPFEERQGLPFAVFEDEVRRQIEPLGFADQFFSDRSDAADAARFRWLIWRLDDWMAWADFIREPAVRLESTPDLINELQGDRYRQVMDYHIKRLARGPEG